MKIFDNFFILLCLFIVGGFHNLYLAYQAITDDWNPVSNTIEKVNLSKNDLKTMDIVGYLTDDEFYIDSYLGYRMYPTSDEFGGLSRKNPINCFVNSGPVRNFYITQFTLAPTVIDNSPFHKLVIGNFYNDPNDSFLIKNKYFKTIKDFGNGILLFEKIK